MVSCERSVVAVAHTHTPRRTARPPAAPPRRERDEEMGQQRRSLKHVWEGSVMRHAARRLSLSGTAPPFRGRRVTATPYALPLLPQRRPPIPPSSIPARILRPRQAARRWASALHAPAPLRPAHTPWPDTHIQDKPGVLLSKEKKKCEGGDQRGRLPAYASPREGPPSPKLCQSITPKPAAAQGALGAACRTAAARNFFWCGMCLPAGRAPGHARWSSENALSDRVRCE